MINLSWFLQSDVQSVHSCNVCTHHPPVAEHEPQAGAAAFNSSSAMKGGAWIFPSLVPHRGGCLLSEDLVQVWVFRNPVVNHAPASMHGDKDPVDVIWQS